MHIKAGSRSCIVANGGEEGPSDPHRWPLTCALPVLGHTLQNNGSIRACWTKTKQSLWRAYWCNPGSKAAAKAGIDARYKLLQRAVAPHLDFRCSRWPPQLQVAKEIDRTQRKMIASILNISRLPAEPADVFLRRRGQIAGRFCREKGLWSQRWFKRAVQWDDHLARPRNEATWAAKLRTYRDREWFIQRRCHLLPARGNVSSATAGRTGTRSNGGKVFMRWHDGILLAQEQLN